MSASGRDAYWRTPELDVGGAWQGWDTKCTAELLAWHWLTVKLRFAGGNQRDRARQAPRAQRRDKLIWNLGVIYGSRSPTQIHVCRRPASGLLFSRCCLCFGGCCRVVWYGVGDGACPTFRFIHPQILLGADPLGTNRTTSTAIQATTSAAVEQRQTPQKA